jgi:hypothetical protein
MGTDILIHLYTSQHELWRQEGLDPGIYGGLSRDSGGEFERRGEMGVLVLLRCYITTYVVALRWGGTERPHVE